MPTMPITQWFNENDAYFEKPMAAIKAGYTYEALLAEYQIVYGDEVGFLFFKADWAKDPATW